MKWYRYIIIGLLFLLIGTFFPSPKVKGIGEITNILLLAFGVVFIGMGRGHYDKEKK